MHIFHGTRGTIGQSVEAIVSIIPNFQTYLKEIIETVDLDMKIIEFAAIIYAFHLGTGSLSVLKAIPEDKSWFIPELINHIEETRKK